MRGGSGAAVVFVVIACVAALWMSLRPPASVVLVAGRNERWVRLVAALGAVDMTARLGVIAARGDVLARQWSGTLVVAILIALVCAINLSGFVARVARRRQGVAAVALRRDLWRSWLIVAIANLSRATNPFAGWSLPVVAWLGVVLVLALVGRALESPGTVQ